MAKHYRPDRLLIIATLGLLALGVVMVFSASAVYASELFGNAGMFVLRQIVWLILGLGALFVMTQVDYRRLCQPAVVFPALCVVLVLLVAVFSSTLAQHPPLDSPGAFRCSPRSSPSWP
jgi:cell division protein FtsW